MSIFKRTIFILTIIFFILLVSGPALFEIFSLEFASSKYSSDLFFNLTYILPIALMLTMTGTIRKENSKKKNGNISALTIFGSFSIFLIMLALNMNASWGGWTNEISLFKNNKNKNIVINQQIWDIGALGYDRDIRRVVIIKPVLSYINQVTVVDTMNIDRSNWTFVNEERYIHNH